MKIKHLCGKEGRCALHLYGSVSTTPIWRKQMCAWEVIGMCTGFEKHSENPPPSATQQQAGRHSLHISAILQEVAASYHGFLNVAYYSVFAVLVHVVVLAEGFQATLSVNYNESECRHFIIDFSCNIVLKNATFSPCKLVIVSPMEVGYNSAQIYI